MLANGSALLCCYDNDTFCSKIDTGDKSNRAGFLRIQRHNREILNRILKRPLK